MTSKNSFLVSSRENHKRRIWVWVISILMQLLMYPGIMTIYLSRIKSWYERGAYQSVERFREMMYEAAADAVGFQPVMAIPITILGVLVAVQGFSYLYDRKKVDMYQSVPVPAKRRFFIIYVNGILIYLIPALVGTLTALLIAGAQGAVNGAVLTEYGLAFIVDILFFLVVYHTSILAVMLTGNIVVTGFAVVTFLFAGYVAVMLGESMRYLFFDTADYFFTKEPGHLLSIVMDYIAKVNSLKIMAESGGVAEAVLPLYGKWIVCAVIILALAYFCYKKRPSEAAGRAITFPVIKPFVKIIISAIIGVAVYYVVEDASYHNASLSVLAMVIGTVLCCGVMEAIYEFDIRGAIKGIASTGISAVVVVVIFCIYQFDIFGYDTYIPDADKVESVAVDAGPYQQYWKWVDMDESIEGVRVADYLRENMFLTDIEAVCELAEKSQGLVQDEIGDRRKISVLYRLKSGREVYRCFSVDCSDASNEELLNRIIGTKEYKEGFYQLFKDDIPFGTIVKQLQLSYYSGVIECGLPAADAGKLRDAWIQDMEQFDFTLARNNRICGYMRWNLSGRYMAIELPVYESFTNTISLLQEYNAYYPIELRAEDIERIEITNHHYNEKGAAGDAAAEAVAVGSYTGEAEDVTEYFEEPQEIEEIIAAIYPESLDIYWNDVNTIDNNYNIVISFKADAQRPYGRGYYYYRFLTGQVPDFVVERTAYPAGN